MLVVLLLAPTLARGAFKTPPYQPVTVKAGVAPYTVKPDLSNVVNRKQYGAFTARQTELLAKQGFFVASGDGAQLQFTYEQNDYLVLPSFVTTDAVLQLYHIFYDYSLRDLEGDRLIPVVGQLTRAMLADSSKLAAQHKGTKVGEAAMKNVAYFGVAAKALDLKVKLPPEAAALVEQEWKLIMDHEGRQRSAIFPYEIDYSQFVPRGHYTRSEKLKRYFRAMMWYGLVPLPVGDDREVAYEQIRQSLLMVGALYAAPAKGKPLIETWERVYEPTAFYVELSDDLTPPEWRGAAEKVWGHLPKPEELEDTAKLKQFHDVAVQLRPPRIATFRVEGQPVEGISGIPTLWQFRFMGQRAIPDSVVLQELVWSNVGTEADQRCMPMGLDVLAALGSARAYEHLKAMGETHYDRYDAQLAKMKTELAGKTTADWTQNLYWGWLWTLKGLSEPAPAGYPRFAQTPAWADKELNTALASWAEIRHDTILYAKQSSTAECGGEEPGKQPPVPKGYVEPTPEVYHRLLWLTQATREGLQQRKLMTKRMESSFRGMEDLLTFLESVSVKELTNQPLKAAEYDAIRCIGADLEDLLTEITGAIGGKEGGLVSDTDEDMAAVADVHTADQAVLEEGVGHGFEIFVVVPIQGKLYLARGAVFSYYEFTGSIADRLTDEAWQKMLREGQAPPQPKWTSSFMAEEKAEIPEPKLPRTERGGGC